MGKNHDCSKDKVVESCPICGLKLKIKYCGRSRKECKNGHMFIVFYREGLAILIQCKDVWDSVWS